ncbi:MAG: phospholipid carrier-dependent glycosyltransferase [Anaerolineae bacterium]|nr:phospholipid carrier-dependent glycosyltransferase [Anaerolineae bacterium]
MNEKVRRGLVLVSILLAALGLRLWGSGFGLPAYTRYHPDEHALVDRAAAILWTGDWNLHRFNYPPFYAYIQAGAYALYFLKGAAAGLWSEVPPFTLPNYYQVGRVVTALLGTLTVLVVYLVGREMARWRASLMAAALLAGCYLHIIHSHYATFDVMVGFLAALTLLFSMLILARAEVGERAAWTCYFFAGLCAGLAGATKYNGAVVFVVPLMAHALAIRWGAWGWLDGRIVLAGTGFALGFFGGNPFALANLPEFLNGLATVLHHYGTEQPGFEGRGNWRWYPTLFATSADALFVAAGTGGLIALLFRRWKRGLVLIAFPVVYYVMASRFVVRFERNMVPLLPFLAVGGGWLLDTAVAWTAQRLRLGARRELAVAAVAVLVVIALPVIAGLGFDATLTRTDHREVAGDWIEENVEWGTKIAIEHYAVPFDHTEYWVVDVIRITDHDLAWYLAEGFDLLVVSDGVWEVLREQPDVYRDRLAALDELTAASTLLATFEADPPALVVAGYPTVDVYHFAPVHVYALPRQDE